ncbi:MULTISPECIES: DNA modification methylase [Microbacterium]|uniref:DNA modification methylase n=1 Tax=Microbacterium TaxID=33882 RepID=UPI001E3E10A4|nr:DNA modification methylase [Microbacterium nymphoidis]MCD2499306.1 DNA modification methylase [Microbacterium nymphoidis]
MNTRALASIALGAAIILGTTGCSMISPQATTIPYSAAEGVNVPNASGPVLVRNAFFITGEDAVNLVAVFVNDTAEDQTATVAVDGVAAPLKVSVPAGERVSYGIDGEHLEVPGLNTVAGDTVKVTFTSGDGTSEAVEVPVLDGTLEYLEEAVPTPSATS